MFETTTKVDPVEINNEEVRGIPRLENCLLVRSHHSNSKLVVLEYNAMRITLYAPELRKAIENACNQP